MKLFTTLLTLSAFCFSAYAGNSTQTLKRIDQLEGSYAAKSSVKIGLFEESTKGWATYADAAGPTPVNGTGGAPTVTFTRSTTSPLEGKASAILTKDAANRQGEGASYDFTLDPAYTGTIPQNMVIEFFYSTGGTFVAGAASDVQVYVYDVTASALITPTTTFIGSSPGRFQSTFLPVAGASSYRLIFHIATTSAAAWTLKVDKISIHEPASVFNTSGISSVATLTTGNGFGSTNTNIRRYSSITTQGTAIACADDAALGTSCTINQDGIYTANRLDRNTGAASNFGIVKNDDCTTGGFDSVASIDQLAYTMAASNAAVNASDAGTALVSGDVLRACDDDTARTNDTTDRTSRLVIAKVRDEALPSAFITATGGTITTDGNYRVHTFTTSGTFTITGGSGTVESLVVAGGGGSGGGAYNGGGGGGGLIYTTPGAIYGPGAYGVVVGAGGVSATNGGNSSFDGIIATGGGAGGVTGGNGAAGGSGGGGGAAGNGGAGTAGQGFAGGSGTSVGNLRSNGGGGCGAVGEDVTGLTRGSNGGVGCSSSITGAAVFYAGGGGGMDQVPGGTGGTGGNGGGGAGAANGNAVDGTPGTNGLGGGGGAGDDFVGLSAPGGDGVVILRYQFQ